MHARSHVQKRKRNHIRKKIGVAALTVATVFSATPHANAVEANRSTTDTTVVQPPKKTRRSWGWRRAWGSSSLHVQHQPSVIEIVLAMARRELGKPYAYGSAGPSTFDCSGLTMFVWSHVGVSLPHNAAAQYASVRHVAMKDVRPGDLVFSGGGGIGHVGIYIGGGRMIHAPHSGARVEVAPLRSNLIGAGRPK